MSKQDKTNNTERRSFKKPILITLCVILSLLLVALVLGTIYLESLFGLIGRVDDDTPLETISESEFNQIMQDEETQDPENTYPTEDPEDVTWGETPDLIQGKSVLNILLIGQDRRPGEKRARSDSMILCTINLSKKTITLSSLMRDMYVQIPGYSSNRINASYALGGMSLLDECLKKNFGIDVQSNVEIDFYGFKDAIDVIGGVDITLTEAEARYLNRSGNWGVDDYAGDWNLQEGLNHMNGSQALAYARYRYDGNGDFGRTNRQRIVLNALMQKAKTMSMTQLNDLLRELLPLLTTDMSDSEIMSLAMDIFPILDELELLTQQIPAEGTYRMAMINGMSVLVPDLTANGEILAEIVSE